MGAVAQSVISGTQDLFNDPAKAFKNIGDAVGDVFGKVKNPLESKQAPGAAIIKAQEDLMSMNPETRAIAQQYLDQVSASRDKYNQAFNQAQSQIGNFNQAVGQTQGSINQYGQQIGAISGQINQGNQAYQQAQQALQNQGGQALGLLRGAAEGTAPSAAQAQLRAGMDEAIRTQQAMANSGAVGGMVGRQKSAMDNAALITQQAANQAAQLRANEMATARGLYGQQAAQYGAQAAQNAGVATNLAGAQTAAAAQAGNLANTNLALAAQQKDMYGQQLNAAQQQAAMYGTNIAAQQAANQQAQSQILQAGQLAAQKQATEQSGYNAQQQATSQVIGGGIGGIGSAFAGVGKPGAAEGGIVPEGMTKHQDGNFVNRQAMYKNGGKIPGKAEVEGNSYKNDDINILVSPGEIIIPRSHCHSAESAIQFIKEIMEKKEESPKEAEIKSVEELSPKEKKELSETKYHEENESEEHEEDESEIEQLMKHLSNKKKRG